MNRQKVIDVLNRDDVRGRIIKDAAIIDSEMGLAIAFYFTTNQRVMPFLELVVERLGFNDKIAILERLPYRKKYLALKSLAHIRHLQQARNRIAHEHYLHDGDGKLKTAPWLSLFDDYPKRYKLSVQAIRRGLGRLIRSNEFLHHFSPGMKKTTNSRLQPTPNSGAAEPGR